MPLLQNNRWRLLLAAGALALGIYLTVNSPATPTLLATGANRKAGTQSALDSKLSELNFDHTPLSRALYVIGSAAGFSTSFDQRAFREEGIDPASLVVTARLRDVRASKAVQTALSDACPRVRLRFFIDDGGIVVTTPRGDARRVETRIYNLADILPEPPRSAEEDVQLSGDIKRLVIETIEPESWKEAGGVIGSVHVQNRFVTVRQTPENLRLLTGLLAQMREGKEAQRLVELLKEDGR